MTRKDYIAIAKALSEVDPSTDDGFFAIRHAAENIADVFEQDNPNFDREKFLDATF